MVELALILEQEPLIEQPDTPRGMIALPCWQRLITLYTFYKAKCKQGCYEAKTEKPTSLFSCHVKWGNMKNTLTAEDKDRLEKLENDLVTRKRDSSGRVRVTGKPKALKNTQSYTAAFGKAIVDAWRGTCDLW